jgi:hypothetical protein
MNKETIQEAIKTLEKDRDNIIKKYNRLRNNTNRHKFSIILYQVDANIENYKKKLELLIEK